MGLLVGGGETGAGEGGSADERQKMEAWHGVISRGRGDGSRRRRGGRRALEDGDMAWGYQQGERRRGQAKAGWQTSVRRWRHGMGLLVGGEEMGAGEDGVVDERQKMKIWHGVISRGRGDGGRRRRVCRRALEDKDIPDLFHCQWCIDKTAQLC